jgi:hypothetical protein
MQQLLKKIEEGQSANIRGIKPSAPQIEGRVQEEE